MEVLYQWGVFHHEQEVAELCIKIYRNIAFAGSDRLSRKESLVTFCLQIKLIQHVKATYTWLMGKFRIKERNAWQ